MNEVELAKTIGVIETDISNMKGNISEIKEMLKIHVEKQDHEIEEMKSTFAGKWVEKIVYGVVAVVITSLLAVITKGL